MKTNPLIAWLEKTSRTFPKQFWLLLAGSLISSTGGSMVWPFLSIYLKNRLGVPLTTVTLLLTLNSSMGLVFALVGGSFADRFGRKGVMLASLLVGCVYFSMMGQTGSLFYYATLLALWGAFNPLYAVGANAMVADLVPGEHRLDAYSLLRVVQNTGVAIGPVAGGFLAIVSMNAAFYGASIAFLIFCLLNLVFFQETLPKQAIQERLPRNQGSRGYGYILKDKQFLGFVLSFSASQMAASLMFILLPVYTAEQFHIPESSFGFIITTNALMCIFIQYFVTLITRRYRSIPVLGIGALFYAIGVGSIVIGRGFWAFIASMAVMTLGELIMTPTASTLVAQIAPPDMRARYMSVYQLTWPIAMMFGPVIGGMLYDNVAPYAMWYGGAAYGLLSALGFLLLWRNARKNPFQPQGTVSVT